MFNTEKSLTLLLQSVALIAVVTIGVLSILATGGSSTGDESATAFADAGPDQNVGINKVVQLDGTGSNTPFSDNPEENVPTYFWTVLSSPPEPQDFALPESYIFDHADIIRPRFVPYIEGEYVLHLNVRFQGHTAGDTVSVFVYLDSPPPNARVGSDLFVKYGALVTLDASDSHSHFEDSAAHSNAPFKYSWYMNVQPAGTSTSLSETDVVNPSFIAEQGRYETRLHVIDKDGLVSKPVHVNTYVFPPEGYVYPVPVVGSSQRVVSGSTVQLDGSASFDVDDRALSYDWQFYARPSGSNATLVGADTTSPSFVADQDGVYVVQLQVNNGERSSIRLGVSDFVQSGPVDWSYDKPAGSNIDYAGNDRVVITVVHSSLISSSAVPDAGPDQTLLFTEPVAIPLDASGSYVPAGGFLYRWYLVSAPSGSNAIIFMPNDTEPDSASLQAFMAGTYVVGLGVGLSMEFNNDHVVITLTENNLPTAVAGDDQAVSVGDTVMLNGASSNDPDGNPLGYSWSLALAPGPWGYTDTDGDGNAEWKQWPALSDGMVASPTFTPDLNGDYLLRLTVNNGEQSSVVDEVLITASGGADNSAPSADAGVDQLVTVGDTVLLNGSDSSDPDNNELTYIWNIQTQPLGSSAAIDVPDSETPSFVADVIGNYEVQLIVNDGLENSAPDTVIISASSPSVATPLTLVSSLPFAPAIPEVPTWVQIDTDASDSIRVISPVDIPPGNFETVLMASLNGATDADFTNGFAWTIISPVSLTINDSNTPTFIIQRDSDAMYYKIILDFTVTASNVQIDSLQAWRCGADLADCP